MVNLLQQLVTNMKAKKITIMGILVLMVQLASAQKPSVSIEIPKDINISLSDKYAGTWEWTSSNSSFTVVLKRNKPGEPMEYFLSGWYRYIKNGRVVINQLDKLDSVKYAALAGSVLKGNDTLKVAFTDETNGKLQRGTINFIDGSFSRINIKLKGKNYREGISLGKRKEYAEKVPENLNIVLKRIN